MPEKLEDNAHIRSRDGKYPSCACLFYKWGIDIVGKVPTSLGGKVFLIVAVDYFSKWEEAEAVVKIDEATIQKFLWYLYPIMAYNSLGRELGNGTKV